MKLSANERFLASIKLLIDSNDYISIEELADFLSISRRSAYYILNDINATLSHLKGNEVVSVYGKGIKLDQQQKKLLLGYYKESPSEEFRSLSQVERYSIIFVSLYTSLKNYTIKTFEELFRVSRFTIINDINQLKNIISRFEISVSFDQKNGYRIEGEEYNVRKAFFYFFANIYEMIVDDKWLVSVFYNETVSVRKHYNKLKKIGRIQDYYDMSLMAIAFVIATYMNKKNGVPESIESRLLPDDQIAGEYAFVSKEYRDLPKIERKWVATCLFCSLISRPTSMENTEYSIDLARKMNDMFYLHSSIEVDNDELVTALAKHIELAFLRYKYGVCINNPLLNEIRNKYLDYFMIVKRTVQVLEQEFGMPINDSEIGFLTLYYAGYVIKQSKQITYIRTLIICAIGLSTTYLLKNEIEEIDSRIKVINCISVEEFFEHDYDADLIISAIPFERKTRKKVYFINSFLSNEDRNTVANAVDEISLSINLKLQDSQNGYASASHNNIRSIFKPEYVHIVDNKEDDDWKELLEDACRPLVRDGYINDDYSEHIIEKINRYGFYMLYRNGYLVGHANIENAKKLGLTFTKLKNTIKVKEQEISKIIVITPINRFDHHFILTGLSTLLKSDELNFMIEKEDNSNELYDIILSIISAY